MKILIVEDEAKTGDYLKQGLSEAGFTADLVRNGVDGMHGGLAGDHDLLILDVNLPVLLDLARGGALAHNRIEYAPPLSSATPCISRR